VTSVFGTVTADKVIPDTSSSLHVLRQVISYTSGETYTQSLIVSSAGYNYVQLVFPAPLFSATAQANFDLATGVLGTVGAGVTASIEDMENGIYRVIATCTATGSGGLAAGPCFISSATSARTETWTPNGTDGLYFHHYQMETGTVASTPIITYGSAVNRAVDTDTSLLNLFPSLGSAYTMYIRYKPASAAVATTGLRLDDTTADELVSIGNNASGQGIVTVTDGGVPDSTTSGTVTSSAFHRIAVSVEANNVLLVVNGGAAAQDTGVTLPTLTRMLLGNTSGQLITQIALFPGARTEAQLQAIGV
jgi:hypothetical protein